MFCPYCGRDFEFVGSYKCPFCGQDVEYYLDDGGLKAKVETVVEDVHTKARRNNLLVIAIIVAIVIVSGALVYSALTHINNNPIEPVGPEDIIRMPGGQYLQLDGGFLDGTMYAYSNGSNQIVIYLGSDVAAPYGKFNWVLKDERDNTHMAVTKTEPEVTWESPETGVYSLTVYCYGDDANIFDSFSGTITCYGKFSDTYIWSYGGKDLSMTLTLEAEDILPYLSSDVQKRLEDQKSMTYADMVVTDNAVSQMSSKLRDSFTREFGAIPENGSIFADFVLQFLHSNFSFEHDVSNYSADDYWAYPTETIYKGCGDDEDASILYASLMRACGFKVGLITMPDLTVAAVAIDDGSLEPVHKGASIMSATIRGVRYLAADARFDSEMAVGEVSSAYSISQDGKKVYVNKTYYSGFGLQLVPEA